jgi:hypothetical protein
VDRALLDGSIRNGETVEIMVHDGKLMIKSIITAEHPGRKP